MLLQTAFEFHQYHLQSHFEANAKLFMHQEIAWELRLFSAQKTSNNIIIYAIGSQIAKKQKIAWRDYFSQKNSIFVIKMLLRFAKIGALN